MSTTTTESPTPDLVVTDEFSDALDALRSGEHTAIFGGAGTGKSTLVRQYLSEIRGTKNAIVTAPTGLAALNVGGYTLHRLFSFRPETTLEEVKGHRYNPAKFGAVLKQLDTLIIDEVSMVRADLFDMVAVALEKFGPKPGEPFGGVQMVLVGDLYQLAPIIDRDKRSSFSAAYDSPYFFAADAYEPDDFSVTELTRVFRQEGDQTFIDILNRIRVGEMTADDREVLNERVDAGFTPPQGEKWLTLATNNARANEHNGRALMALPGPSTTLWAQQTGNLEGFELPVPRQIDVKVGAQIMMATNAADGSWVNGSIGTVTYVGAGWGLPSSVRVEIDGVQHQVFQNAWEVTEPRVQEDKSVEHVTVGTYSQYPFKLAWAVTIHKSQGQTLDHVVVDLDKGTFAAGQLYVALSRCTSLEGMVLHRPIKRSDMKTDRTVTKYLDENAVEEEALGTCSLDLLVTAAEGRILQITATTDAGESLTSIVNPECDYVLDAVAVGIDPTLVPFAPLLEQAVQAISGMIDGYSVTEASAEPLAVLTAELKEIGARVKLPRRPGRGVVHATDEVGYLMGSGAWPACLGGEDPEVALGHIRSVAEYSAPSDFLTQKVAEAEALLAPAEEGDEA